MSSMRKLHIMVTAMVVLSLWPVAARADFIKDTAFGLGALGFDIRGDENILSGGIDMLVTNLFRGSELDFGLGDITFQGPISMQLATGIRGFPEIEFSFTTATNSNAFISPLNYAFNYDIGAQSASVTGNFLLDLDVTLNGLGFYDLGFSYISTQNVFFEGVFLNSDTDNNVTIDPINISGNIYIDILTVITNPFFNAAGVTNPLTNLSGLARLNSFVDASSTRRGISLSEEELSLAVLNELNPDSLNTLPDPLFSGSNSSSSLTPLSSGVVPEPTVLLLMLLGLPAMIRRPRRRTR